MDVYKSIQTQQPNTKLPDPTFPRVFELHIEDHNSHHNTATK